MVEGNIDGFFSGFAKCNQHFMFSLKENKSHKNQSMLVAKYSNACMYYQYKKPYVVGFFGFVKIWISLPFGVLIIVDVKLIDATNRNI